FLRPHWELSIGTGRSGRAHGSQPSAGDPPQLPGRSYDGRRDVAHGVPGDLPRGLGDDLWLPVSLLRERGGLRLSDGNIPPCRDPVGFNSIEPILLPGRGRLDELL